jgi:hypothetical protein
MRFTGLLVVVVAGRAWKRSHAEADYSTGSGFRLLLLRTPRAFFQKQE